MQTNRTIDCCGPTIMRKQRPLEASGISCYYPALIEQIRATQDMLSKLLALLESSEADKCVAHLYQARKQYRRVCERPNKGTKAIEREVISSYQIAQSLGFNGDFRAWEHLLRIHE